MSVRVTIAIQETLKGAVPNFHSQDPNLIINALRLILEGYKFLRSRGGKGVPEKQEEVLEETVAKAEEMSAQGATAETVGAEIETSLERDLGKAVKDEIVSRASSILALAHPFDPEAFRYYENLTHVLKRAQSFCAGTNIFQLRGASNGVISVLPMPQLNQTLVEITQNFRFFCGQLRRGDILEVVPSTTGAFLSTKPEAVHVKFVLSLKRAQVTGGTYMDRMSGELSLSPGSEVNKIGFNVARPAESPYLMDFEIRLTGKEFQQVVSAVLDDLNRYATELAEEQRDFKERLAPQLAAVFDRWMKP
jgi:hypothetical protein